MAKSSKDMDKKAYGMPALAGISIFLLVLLAVSIITAVAFGSSKIPFAEVYGVVAYKLFGSTAHVDLSQGPIHDVIWLIRMPRTILAVAVGGGLAFCGLIMQAVVKNPLADPYILGVSSGASMGATLAIMLGVGIGFGTQGVGIMAFLGAVMASMLVLLIANMGSRANPVKLLLSGMAVRLNFFSIFKFHYLCRQ